MPTTRPYGELVAVEKDEVIERLEPLTRRYYGDFVCCTDCSQIYWPGSHHEKLLNLVERLRKQL